MKASRNCRCSGTRCARLGSLIVLRAETPALLAHALTEKCISLKQPSLVTDIDFHHLKASYTPENRVAEHISPPLSEEVKVTLKVSQNLHASMTPWIPGAVLGKATDKSTRRDSSRSTTFCRRQASIFSSALRRPASRWRSIGFLHPGFHGALPRSYGNTIRFQPLTQHPARARHRRHVGNDPDQHARSRTRIRQSRHLWQRISPEQAPDAGGQRPRWLHNHPFRRTSQLRALRQSHILPNDPDAAQNIAGQALGAIAAVGYQCPIDRTSIDTQ